MKRKTHEEFIEQLSKINPNIEVLNKYINRRTKVKSKCLIDNYEWEVDPMSLLNGHGCPKCAGVAPKTHKEFIEELFLVNPNITVLDTYINSHAKVSVKCNIDGHIWKVQPYSLLNGRGCPKCGKVYSMSHEEFVDEMKLINNQIEITGIYHSLNKKINVKCNVDGHTWLASPQQLLRGDMCPVCRRNQQSERQKKPHDTFVKEMKDINPNIEIVGKYVSSSIKILVRCKLDNNEWLVTPNNLLKGSSCPKCIKNTESNGEKLLAEYFLANNIKFERQKEFDDLVGLRGGKLKYDFYLQKFNTLVEFDGIQHFQPVDYFGGLKVFKVQKYHDNLKDNYAKANNYNLIRIPYWEINNLNEIIKQGGNIK